MMETAPSYTFSLTPDRFDMQVMAAFQEEQTARAKRDNIISGVRSGQYNHQLLCGIDGLQGLSHDVCERAAINIIDFHFETLVLARLNERQLEAYFQSITKSLKIRDVDGLDKGGPLWIDTVHHACIFSVIYEFVANLARHLGYRKLVLVHQGTREESRLNIVGRMLAKYHQVSLHCLKLGGKWFSQLARIITPDTIVLYLVDMPPETSARRTQRKINGSIIRLSSGCGIALTIEALSGSATFARRLQANHIVLEYPTHDSIVIRPYDEKAPSAHCRLEDWIFWPLLRPQQ